MTTKIFASLGGYLKHDNSIRCIKIFWTSAVTFSARDRLRITETGLSFISIGERKNVGEEVDRSGRLKITQWVVREVLVHEHALRAWLKKAVGPNDVEDVIQESYCRISNLEDISHIRNGRAYLFTTARMIIIERVRRSTIVRIETVAELDRLQISCEVPSPEDEVIAQDNLDRVRKLIDDLPDRCRSIFRMRKVEGLSQREVSMKLGIAEHTVENDVAKGLRLILKAIADGEQQAELSLESTDGHERTRLNTGNR